MTPQAVCEFLYVRVRPVLKKESVDPDRKKMLACKYVCFMADIKSGKKRERELRLRYKEILVLIKKIQAEG